MAVAAHGLGGLQQMLDLGEIGVGIAVVDQRVEKLGRLPDGLLAPGQAEVLLFLAQHVVDGLVLVVQAVELGDAGRGGRVVHAELFLGPAFLVPAFEKLIPFFEIMQGFPGCRCQCAHKPSSQP